MLRKTLGVEFGARIVPGASMRPQRNAAENTAFGRGSGSWKKASMRPQRNAAENSTLFVMRVVQYALQ